MTVHVLLTADNHLDPSAINYGARRFDRKRDFQRCFEAVINYALQNKPDLLLIAGDFYDGILPGNRTRAFVAEQFKILHEKGVNIVMVSGDHDTPKSLEQGMSPLSVHARSGHVQFLDEPRPTSRIYQINGDMVQVTGVSLNPNLSPEQDPLGGIEIERNADVNIFLTHYPIEGFDGYFGQEVHIRKSSIPRRFQLFASGHLHHRQKKTVNETAVYYPGSTERTSFNEEFEQKGFYSLKLDRGGVTHEEFHPTPARRMETLDCQVFGQASLTRQVQEAVEKKVDTEKILRVRVSGKVTLDQLSTYKRSSLLAYCQDKFFHVDFDEDSLNLLTATPLESLPRTTPLEEIDRTFQTLLANATEQERPLIQDAWKLTLVKLQEEGVT